MGWDVTGMAVAGRTGKPVKGRKQAPKRRTDADWTSGLKQLYDSVIEEPIPDSFMDLLSKLDNRTS